MDLWGGLTDLEIQGLCMSLLIEPFKKNSALSLAYIFYGFAA
jgi:hypothetical protein